MSILVFEPDRKEQEDIAKILRDAGYLNVKFTNTLEDLGTSLGLGEYDERVVVSDVELIVLDVSSDRSVIDYARKIKDHVSYEEIPLIIISVHSAPETLQMAFAYGATDFIAKPLRNYEFLARVRSALIYKHETDRRKAREKELLEVTRQLSDLNAVLNRLSLIDGLTGISNRRFFDQSIVQEWRLCFRNERPLSVILMDVDHFKLYNDTYGHQAGDQTLKKIAQYVRGCLRRPSDLLARYGGEEFAAILPDTDLTGAMFVADRIKITIEGVCIPHGKSETSDRITLSLGVGSCIPFPGFEPDELVRTADSALYEAKNSGRNCVRGRLAYTKEDVEKAKQERGTDESPPLKKAE